MITLLYYTIYMLTSRRVGGSYFFAEIEFDNERELELRDEFYRACGPSFA